MMPAANSPAPIPDDLAVLSVAEMYAADKAAVAHGVPSIDLMEAAGGAVARTVGARWRRQPVAVLCGPGNNGGDGFVAARLLAREGWPVRVALLGHLGELSGEAAINAQRWQDMGGEVESLEPSALDGGPLVIDAIFGAGLARPLAGKARDVAARINEDKLTCIAVDVPSGVCGDSGRIIGGDDGAAPRCAATVTFFRPKPGHLLYPGRDLCGDLTVADIGVPAAVLAEIRPTCAHNRPGLWRLPQRKWSDHKYDRGYAVVVGGNPMTGAARLAGRAARRAGAGLLRMAVPAEVVPLYAADAPGAFVQALDRPEELTALLADRRRNGVLIGPGAGTGTATCMRVLEILASERAVVLDADALTAFESEPETLLSAIGRAKGPVVITPHDGEFARLFKDIPGSRLERSRAAAARSGAIVIAKGADTVVASPKGCTAIATHAPPWLATGGTGDVLAGFVLGLLVQKMEPWAAACAAVWLHGEAGRRLGPGLIAEDLPEALPALLAAEALD